METKTQERLHSLDALRAVMMLLGLVVHTAPSYIANPTPESWAYSDPDRSVLFDITAYFIHMFRMPAFFLLSGFFAQMLIERRGPRGFLQNRAARILVPLLLFFIPLHLADAAAFASSLQQPVGPAVQRSFSELLSFWRSGLFGHLWFLHYLLFLCLALALCWRWLQAYLSRVVAWSLLQPWGLLLLALPVAALLHGMPFAVLMSSDTLVPDLSSLLLCGIFFGFGAVLYPQRELLERLPGRGWWSLIISVLTLFGNMGLLFALVEGGPSWLLLPISLLGAVAMWMMVFAWMGLFLRYFAAPSVTMRYLSGASYWVYLMHHSLCIFFVGVIAPIRTFALVKFTMVVFIVAAICLLSYHILVRRTWIGVLLNGKRAGA